MAQPPDLTGGAGFTFEDAAVAIYLSALLGEQSAPGLEGRVVSRVAVQQRNRGEPLDDLIVDGTAPDQTAARLSLQVKRSLVVASGNADFREIVRLSWETLNKPEFREDLDRVGGVTGTVSDIRFRQVSDVAAWAKASTTVEELTVRFTPGEAGGGRREVFNTFRTLLAEEVGDQEADAAAYRLLRHFVLLRFDLVRDGATDQANAVERIRSLLHNQVQAEELWRHLRILAREAAGTARVFDRKALLISLGGRFRFIGSPYLQHDLACVREETANALRTIPVDIDGVVIQRSTLLYKARTATATHRFVHIVGLPGTGKSAVLRSLVEYFLPLGTTLLLKSDRLFGPTWATHGRALGINAGVEILLIEIASTGNSILFIDGIDRIEVANRGVVLDLVNAILSSPSLSEWKIIATSRDNGIEPLRTWLPPALLQGNGVETIAVTSFGDSEARELAEERPSLDPLLFGDERVREIARRPFFAAVLSRSMAHTQESPPQSEIELIQAWWERGGAHDADDNHLYKRQRTLVALARTGAIALGRRIRLDGLDLETLRELKRDNIVRDVERGHTVGFAHDIFFEWAYLHLLLDRDDTWIEELQTVGEPPVLGRVVELLSQDGLRDPQRWEYHLTLLEDRSLRPQWARAWLLAPFGTPKFWDVSNTFTTMVFKDNGRRLAKLAVWFQAEKTRANPLILSKEIDVRELSRSEIIRVADNLAWPSDISAWRRFCWWSLTSIAQYPVAIIPDLLSAFEVWQNMCADIENELSHQIVATTAKWLEDIEDRQHAEEFCPDRGVWEGLRYGELEEFERRLRSLLLRSARVEYTRVEVYLHRVSARPNLRRHTYTAVAGFSPILAERHAQALVRITLDELLGPLPEQIAAAPDHGSLIGHEKFSDYHWRELSIRDHGQGFFPASPLREPFAALFKYAPNEALALVRDITNHAIIAWRQLFIFDRHRGGATPRPLTLNFPWGKQEFWGTRQTYMWSRGQWAPNPVACALMALEQWAMAEIESGRPVDAVIKEVLRDHQSCAVLAIAVLLALGSQRLSAVTLPLATSQMIWHWDIERWISDESRHQPNLMGFIRFSDISHARAVDAANRRQERSMEVRSLASLFAIAADAALRECAQIAIKEFPENLPINFEEDANDPERMGDLRRRAEIWSEVGELDHYRARPAADGSGTLIELQAPSAQAPDVVAVREQQVRMNDRAQLLLWIDQSIESASVSPSFELAEAIRRARSIDHDDLFTVPNEPGVVASWDQGVVAGIAAVVLRYGGKVNQEVLAWAENVIGRSIHTPEKRHNLFAGSKLIYHPCLYSVTGIEGLLQRNIHPETWRPELLRLGGNVLEEVSQNAIAAALGLWVADPKLAWAALNLGIAISTASRDALPSVYGYDHATQPERIAVAVASAIAEAEAEEARNTIEPLPAAWVFAPVRDREDWRPKVREQKPVWREPDIFLRWDFLPKILARIPIAKALADSERRTAFVEFCGALVNWTNERVNPAWRDHDFDRRDRRSTELYEWRQQVFSFLGHVVLLMDRDEAERYVLRPILAHDDDEISDSLIHPFLDALVAVGVLDAPALDPNALRYIEACRDRILNNRAWRRARRDKGEIYGFHLPYIVRTLFFIAVNQASAAARFANGDWHEISKVLPVIDPIIRRVGDISDVVSAFLTLCERSLDYYPSERFVEQIQALLTLQEGIPAGWRHTTISARIAALVHDFAERSMPLRPELASAMLHILDRLVDMGDRRSAALQTSEVFKEVRL